MKTLYSLRTVSGLNPEMEAGSFRLPDELTMMLEERFGSEESEPVIDADLIPVLLPRAEKRMLQACFGKWLPNGADGVIQSTREYLIQHAEERGYPLDVTDHIAATVWNCQRVKELEKWKEEQKTIRRAQRHFLHEKTAKQTVDGKRQWVDATVYELPPLVQSDRKSMKHVPARYAVLLPDGTCWDLGRTQGSHAPILSDGPDIALQRIATRAGLSLRGGAHTILQLLTGYTGIIPSYMTVWSRDQWLVLVGWQLDPKLTTTGYEIRRIVPEKPEATGPWWTQIEEPTNSNGYKLDESGNLTQSPSGERLTLSELDYHLLKGAADTAIEDHQGDIIDYMNEEEELVMQGFMRDETDEPEPMDSFLLVQAAANMGLSVDLRNGSAIWNHPELRDQLAVMLRESLKERHQLTGSIRRIKAFCGDIIARIIHSNPSPLEKEELKTELKGHYQHMGRLKNRRTALLVNFQDQLEDLKSQASLTDWSPVSEYWSKRMTSTPTPVSSAPDACKVEATGSNEPYEGRGFTSMLGTEAHPPAMEPVRTEPCMALSPANEVQPNGRLFHMEHEDPTGWTNPSLPEARTRLTGNKTIRGMRVKRGTIAVTGFDLGLGVPVKKAIPKLPQAPLRAQNASPKLKATLRKLIREELETGTLEQEVSDCFAVALEQALRGALRAG